MDGRGEGEGGGGRADCSKDQVFVMGGTP